MTTKQTTVRRSCDISAFRVSVKDTLSAAECYHSTSAEIDASLQKLKTRYNLPGYAWQWMEGYRDARIDSYYRYRLCFCYVIAGELVEKSWDAMTEEQREFCRSGKNTVAGHWWKDDSGKPISGRPFFVSEDTQAPKDPVTGHYPPSINRTDAFKN